MLSTMARSTTVLVLCGGILGAPGEARAQFLLGLQASYGSGVEEGVRAAGLGTRASIPLGPADLGLELVGSFDFFLPDCPGQDCTYFGLNGNVVYRVPPSTLPFRPYVGGGVHHRNFRRAEVGEVVRRERNLGANAIAGAELRPGWTTRPYVEARFEWMDQLRNQFVVSAGILF